MIYETDKKISEEEIFKFLYKKISIYKIPKLAINCKKLGLNEIPKASNGKILRDKIIKFVNQILKK